MNEIQVIRISRLTFPASVLSFFSVKRSSYDPHDSESLRRVPSQTRDTRAEGTLINEITFMSVR